MSNPARPVVSGGHPLGGQHQAGVVSASEKALDTGDVAPLEEGSGKGAMDIDDRDDKFEDATEHQPNRTPPDGKEGEQDIAMDLSDLGRAHIRSSPAEQSLPRQLEMLTEQLRKQKQRREYAEHIVDERQKEITAEKARNQALWEEITVVRRQLEQVRDHVFRIQPRRSDITENEAVDMFNRLLAGIKRWVQNRLSPILLELDGGRLEGRRPPANRADLIRYAREEAKEWFRAHESDEYHVLACIMQYLKCRVFDESFYCPNLKGDDDNGQTMKFVDDICKSMRLLPRDPSRVRDWRSEALATLTSTTLNPDFERWQRQHADMLTQDLASCLSVAHISSSNSSPALQASDEFYESVRQSIIRPAVELAHRLQLGMEVYSLRWADPTVELSMCECLSPATGFRPLAVPAGGKQKLKFLFGASPGLFIDVEDGTAKILSKPAVVVHDETENMKRGPTVMGWLSVEGV